MAYTSIIFTNPHTGETREAPVGFSWTTFFFGCFPALFRSDWKWAIIQFLSYLVTFGLSWLVFIFIYNKLYIKELVALGYQAKSIASGNVEHVALELGIQIPLLET